MPAYGMYDIVSDTVSRSEEEKVGKPTCIGKTDNESNAYKKSIGNTKPKRYTETSEEVAMLLCCPYLENHAS